MAAMTGPQQEITHVSDTALMVAAARALETARPDGVVNDPFARLAGERGMAILQGLQGADRLTFGVGIRTRYIDEMLLELLASNDIGTVLILGTGLDTRPWRLDLPPQLHWMEVDFQEMLAHKSGLLAEAPRCNLERISADLNDPAARAIIFASGHRPDVLITEGLLMYLPAATVEGIARDAANAGVRYWITELVSPEFAQRIGMNNMQPILSVAAADRLNGTQTKGTMERCGWSSVRHRNYSSDVMAAIPQRVTAYIQAASASGTPLPAPPPPDDISGVHLFARG
jgi:methyltransferase (TIGR00027 family)